MIKKNEGTLEIIKEIRKEEINRLRKLRDLSKTENINIKKEFEEIKKQRDNLVRKNITLEEENIRLAGEIKELKEKIIRFCKTMEILGKLLI